MDIHANTHITTIPECPDGDRLRLPGCVEADKGISPDQFLILHTFVNAREYPAGTTWGKIMPELRKQARLRPNQWDFNLVDWVLSVWRKEREGEDLTDRQLAYLGDIMGTLAGSQVHYRADVQVQLAHLGVSNRRQLITQCINVETRKQFDLVVRKFNALTGASRRPREDQLVSTGVGTPGGEAPNAEPF